jgi:hypothetical protein
MSVLVRHCQRAKQSATTPIGDDELATIRETHNTCAIVQQAEMFEGRIAVNVPKESIRLVIIDMTMVGTYLGPVA